MNRLLVDDLRVKATVVLKVLPRIKYEAANGVEFSVGAKTVKNRHCGYYQGVPVLRGGFMAR
jgi:hypothetical protein